MSRFIIQVGLFASLLGQLMPVTAEEAGIWVAMRVEDGLNQTSEYHGWMERKQFWDIISNKQKQGVFRLQNVFWISEKGNVIPLSQVSLKGESYGYGKDAFFHIEKLYRLIPLDEQFVADKIKKAMANEQKQAGKKSVLKQITRKIIQE